MKYWWTPKPRQSIASSRALRTKDMASSSESWSTARTISLILRRDGMLGLAFIVTEERPQQSLVELRISPILVVKTRQMGKFIKSWMMAAVMFLNQQLLRPVSPFENFVMLMLIFNNPSRECPASVCRVGCVPQGPQVYSCHT
jgi:hypothetical protein